MLVGQSRPRFDKMRCARRLGVTLVPGGHTDEHNRTRESVSAATAGVSQPDGVGLEALSPLWQSVDHQEWELCTSSLGFLGAQLRPGAAASVPCVSPYVHGNLALVGVWELVLSRSSSGRGGSLAALKHLLAPHGGSVAFLDRPSRTVAVMATSTREPCRLAASTVHRWLDGAG